MISEAFLPNKAIFYVVLVSPFGINFHLKPPETVEVCRIEFRAFLLFNDKASFDNPATAQSQDKSVWGDVDGGGICDSYGISIALTNNFASVTFPQ